MVAEKNSVVSPFRPDWPRIPRRALPLVGTTQGRCRVLVWPFSFAVTSYFTSACEALQILGLLPPPTVPTAPSLASWWMVFPPFLLFQGYFGGWSCWPVAWVCLSGDSSGKQHVTGPSQAFHLPPVWRRREPSKGLQAVQKRGNVQKQCTMDRLIGNWLKFSSVARKFWTSCVQKRLSRWARRRGRMRGFILTTFWFPRSQERWDPSWIFRSSTHLCWYGDFTCSYQGRLYSVFAIITGSPQSGGCLLPRL